MKYLAIALSGLALISISASANAQYRYGGRSSGESVLVNQVEAAPTIADQLSPAMPAAPSLKNSQLNDPGLSDPGLNRPALGEALGVQEAPQTLDLGTPAPAMPVPDGSSSPMVSPAQPMPMAGEIPAPILQSSPAPAAPVPSPSMTHSHNGQIHYGHSHPGYQQGGQVRYYRVKKKQNVFEKLWEMEKRKNAWLKRKFLGM